MSLLTRTIRFLANIDCPSLVAMSHSNIVGCFSGGVVLFLEPFQPHMVSGYYYTLLIIQ